MSGRELGLWLSWDHYSRVSTEGPGGFRWSVQHGIDQGFRRVAAGGQPRKFGNGWLAWSKGSLGLRAALAFRQEQTAVARRRSQGRWQSRKEHNEKCELERRVTNRDEGCIVGCGH